MGTPTPKPISNHPAAELLPSTIAATTNVDTQAWLTDVLARIATHPIHRLDELFASELEDASRRSRSGRLIMHVNKSHVKTINLVAKDLGEDDDWLFDVATETA